MLQNGEGLGRGPLWIITGSTNDWAEVLQIDYESGEETLPVFSSKKEAEAFLSLLEEPDDKGWQVKQTTPGELISVLFGPCRDVARVALDPPLQSDLMVSLVSTSRSRFVQSLAGETRESRRVLGESDERRLVEVEGIPDYVMWDFGS